MNNFKERVSFYEPNFGELTIFDDNCVLQNNNNITICYII